MSVKLEPAPDLRKSRGRKSEPRDSKTVKQLLGELYADKDYLEKLLQETGNISSLCVINERFTNLWK